MKLLQNSRFPELRRQLPWLALLAIALAPRFLLLWRLRPALIESDEAVMGLMARHLLRGEWTSFYWGQHYLGSLEAILAAIPLWFFGPSPLVLKLEPLGDLSRLPVDSRTPAEELLPKASAFWATALVGCSPAFLMIWSMKSRGYMSALLLGSAALLVAARILRSPKNRVPYAALGLLLGLGWWGHFLVIVYLVPIAITLLLVDEPQTIRRLPLLGGSFLLGSLPFWIYNLVHHWASLELSGVLQTHFHKDLLSVLRPVCPFSSEPARAGAHQDLFPS